MNTSYFANIHKIKKPVSISQGPPWWYSGPAFPVLAPPWPLIHAANRGEIDEATYTAQYVTGILLKLDPRQTYDTIVSQFGEDCTLLCFEDLSKSGEFCHRRLVAFWFEDNLGIEVPEWHPPPRFRSSLSW